jgi:hypothetical protein
MGEPQISQLLEESDRSGVALVCAGRDEQETKDRECESCVSHLYIHGYCKTRAGARHVDAPGRLIIWGPGQTNNLAPLNRHFSKFFCLGQGWRISLKTRAQITDNFGKFLSRADNLSAPAPHFRFLQWHLSAPYRLAPQTAARVARCTWR